ncbi:hypothetical protein AXF42_Ash015383 [Apostasia shenzhenica]|uniref:RNase H type-1 domain-containing protein n=1 Tax=Apostasia shenzhenica TaxID=1088818 RepID=A0A2H9ZS25_9ASPA|nr:hypothetical protein AXF42_Ash015383 [Apostasia shenzhenica]
MGATLHQAVTLQFKATNNQAEYEALIAGLNFALSMAIKRIQVFSDSLLVVNQVNQTFETKDEVLKKYLKLARSLISLFENFSLTHIPREENQVADRLAKEGHPDLHRLRCSKGLVSSAPKSLLRSNHPAGWMRSLIT